MGELADDIEKNEEAQRDKGFADIVNTGDWTHHHEHDTNRGNSANENS